MYIELNLIWQKFLIFFNYRIYKETITLALLANSQVFNSRKLRSDALIGGFHMDVGTIYEEEDHLFKNKWLLLTSPEDSTAGAMGYLQVSMTVIGTGDEAPVCWANFGCNCKGIFCCLLKIVGTLVKTVSQRMSWYG